jgi:hypothetical protein
VGALATVVAAVAGSILLWAALEKARHPGGLAATLRHLGVPSTLVRAAGLVIAVELGVGLGLVFRPDSLLTQGGVVVVASAFAVAGLLALRRDEPVPCTCFGPGSPGYLGVNQIAALVPWVGAAAILNAADVARPAPSEGASILAVVALAMAGLRLVRVLDVSREARADRRSARETYAWLQR